MKQKARISFNSDEQRVEDLLRAIKIIKNAIPHIIRLGEVEKKLPMEENNITLLSEIEVSLNNSLQTCSVEKKLERIRDELAENSKFLKEAKERYAALKEEETNLKIWIQHYEEYAKIFTWVTVKDFENLLNKYSFVDNEWYAMLFFISNVYAVSLRREFCDLLKAKYKEVTAIEAAFNTKIIGYLKLSN